MNRDQNLTPVDILIAENEGQPYEHAPMDATLAAEMLTSLAHREQGARRWAAIKAGAALRGEHVR